MKNQNPRRGGNTAGAAGNIKQSECSSPPPEIQPHFAENDTAAIDVVQLNEREARGVDAANDYDRAFFAAHPPATVYVRNIIPGELAPLETPVHGVVVVRQISPGLRMRHVIPDRSSH